MPRQTVKILGVGNALLDINLKVTATYLQQLNLPSNTQLLTDESTKSRDVKVFKDLFENPKASINTGGCCGNTLKFIQQVSNCVNLPIKTSFVGKIGKDVQGEKFKSLMDEQVTSCNLLVSEHAQTGKVACLVEGENRTLLADLGAVEEPIVEFPNISDFSAGNLHEYNLCYLPGMFLNSSGNGILKEFFTKRSDIAIIAVNLSATFIINDDAGFERLLFAAERADIIFGNEEEWELFQKRTRNYFVKLDGDFVENGSSKDSLVDFDNKIVVVTRGGKDTKVRYNFGIARESYPVNDVHTIVDTTGAGDAFVAGFLAFFMCKSNENRLNQENYGLDEMLNDKTLIQTSIKWGHAVAENCIHQIGAEIDLQGWTLS